MSMIPDESQVIAWKLTGETMTLSEYIAPLRAELAALRERLGDADIALHDTLEELAALRAVAVAAVALHDAYHDEYQENRRRATADLFMAILAARAAGYLPTAEGETK